MTTVSMRIGVRLGNGLVVAAVAVDADGAVRQVLRADLPARRSLTASVADALRALDAHDQDVSAVVFDLSDPILRAPGRAVVSLRITPRRLPDRSEPHQVQSASVHRAWVRGGHNALGEDLVGLDEDALRAVAGTIPAGAHLAVTAAGATVNPEHEHRAAEIVRAAVDLAAVTESHWFPVDSLHVREQTAITNSALVSTAEELTSRLGDAVRAVAPGARMFFSTTEGGAAPLTRLPDRPVHAIRATTANELLGAAALVRRTEGPIGIVGADGTHVGEMVAGVLSSRATTSLPDGTVLAVGSPHLLPLDDTSGHGAIDDLRLVDAERDGSEPLPTGIDLAALGAAVAPVSTWYHRTEVVRTAADVDRVLRAGESAVRMTLVAAGASPAAVRFPESRVLGSSYGLAEVVHVRVRGVAGAAPALLAPATGRAM